MNKILVTGGAGFIGSNLCAELVKDSNNTVWSLDNYSTGSRDNHVDGVHYIDADTTQLDATSWKFVPDIIYHLGEYSRVEQSFDDIAKVWKSNKDGTFAVLEFARKINAKLIYAGSSTKFTDDAMGPNQSPYAWTKSSNTQLVQNYGEWFGLDYAITYFYNNFGPNEISTGKYATVIAKFIQKMKCNEKITITSPGTQLRNFTHVEDTINGLILVGEHGHGDDYGIGNFEAYSIIEIANMLGVDYELIPEKQGNRMSARLCTAKVEALGWKPTKFIKDYLIAARHDYENQQVQNSH